MYSASRYHDISAGHRVVGHEGKCAHLHGHNYRIHFTARPISKGLDDVGRVVDFSVLKEVLSSWVEGNWDHKILIWKEDPFLPALLNIDPMGVVAVSFNPTAENMARWLLQVVGPTALAGTGAYLESVTIEETAKCSATFSLSDR